MTWQERTASPDAAGRLLQQYVASPACDAIKDADGKGLQLYVDPDFTGPNVIGNNQATIRKITDACRSHVDTEAGKQWKPVVVKESDVRAFMQSFALGAVMAYDAAPWGKTQMQLELVPTIPRGYAKYDPYYKKIIVSYDAICKFCQHKNKGEAVAMKEARYADIGTDEFPFIMGAEEARHASQRHNPDVLKAVVAKINEEDKVEELAFVEANRKFLVDEYGEQEGTRQQEDWIRKRNMIGNHVRPLETFDKYVEDTSSVTSFGNIPHHKRFHEVDAGEFVGTLRGRFAEVKNALNAGIQVE